MGFVIVVLGGIGVWSVTRVFVRQKMRSVAVLKCLGASTAEVLGTYVLQVALLALGDWRRTCPRAMWSWGLSLLARGNACVDVP